MFIRKFVHINKFALVALLVMCSFYHDTYSTEQQGTWERFTSSPVVKYAPSLASAGVGLYGLHNFLTRGISRDSVYALGLAASPILAQYALYRDGQQPQNPNPLVYPEPANKLRFAVPTLSLMALLALHGGYRNFWSTAPYQAALTTAGLVAPGAINAWWKVQDEQEDDIQRLSTWQGRIREKKENEEQLAQNLLLDPSILNTNPRVVENALNIIHYASEEKKQNLANQLTVAQANNWVHLTAKGLVNYTTIENWSNDILHRLQIKQDESDISSLLSKINDGDLGKVQNAMLEADFRAILSYLSNIIQFPDQVKRIVTLHPKSISNILAIVNDRELMRDSYAFLSYKRLYGDILLRDVLAVEEVLQDAQRALEQKAQENEKKERDEISKQLKISNIVTNTFNNGYALIPAGKLGQGEQVIMEHARDIAVNMKARDPSVTWANLEQGLTDQYQTLTDNGTIPNRKKLFDMLVTIISLQREITDLNEKITTLERERDELDKSWRSPFKVHQGEFELMAHPLGPPENLNKKIRDLDEQIALNYKLLFATARKLEQLLKNSNPL